MERTKKISTQTLAIAILSLLLVASLVMSMTGAWFADTKTSEFDGTFGTIELTAIPAGVFSIAMDDPNTVIMPGDLVSLSFTVENNGTAQMYARFSLSIVVTDIATNVISTDILADLELLDEWSLQGGYYYYVGDPVTSILDVEDSSNVVASFLIPAGLTQNYQGKAVSFNLTVEAVQVANNDMGTANQPWTADWTASDAI